MNREQKKHLEKINSLLRYWILDMTTTAGSGHPTSSLSAVELMSTLMFSNVFYFDVDDVENIHNDRLIFSKGHASPLFYSLWAAAGAIKAEELQTYRKFGSRLEGHPTRKFPFTEVATGSLGQGLSMGVGMAIAQKYLDKTRARTFVLMGDSEMAEGQVWEAIQIAKHYQLDNLVGIIDVNRLGQRGETMCGHDLDVYINRVRAFGWRVVMIDGHDISDIYRIYHDVVGISKKPLMIIAKTFKGRGISFLEDKYSWHGKVLSDHEFSDAVAELGVIDFDVRGDITKPKKYHEKMRKIVSQYMADMQIKKNGKYASRDVYGDVLIQLMQIDERIVVLDAEVSNSTRAEKVREYFPERFFEMFIAEQNMISVAVGLARRGYHPFVSTFAAFLTRAHDQIRMAQYNDVDMTIVGSHAGVSIGEDGSSQMGLEDVAMIRSMINSSIFCPSDVVSTKKIVRLARYIKGISYVRITREATSVLYDDNKKFVSGGMQLLHRTDHDDVVIIGMGITVHEACTARNILKHENINVRVIDLYSSHPVNIILLKQLIGTIQYIIIVEDHYPAGSIGEEIIALLAESPCHVRHLCVNAMPCSGTAPELRKYEKIDFNAIINELYILKKNYDRSR